MIQLIERVNEIFKDLGECYGVEYSGTLMNDQKDARQCTSDAIVALISGEYRGLVLCGKCYAKLQRLTD